MSVRIKDGMIPYTGGDGIEITDNHVINVLLRAANNLIHINENKELYVDLQLPDGIEPTDTFPAGVTVGRILEEDGRDHSGLILNWKTISGDYCRLIYASDTGDLYYDPGTGERIKLGNLFGGTAWGDITGILSNQTDLQQALDEKVNIGNNLILDGTVVSIKEAHDSGGTVVGSGKRVDIDPAGEVTAHKATVSGYDESELGAGELTLTHNTALGGTQTATIDNEKISADNGQITKDYAFFGNDRIATLSDLSGITPPPVDVNVKYFYLSGTTGQSNLDTAMDAYLYVMSSGVPVIGLNGVIYIYDYILGGKMYLSATPEKTVYSSYSTVSKKRLELTIASDLSSITTITETTVNLFTGIELNQTYALPYTPTNPGDPATKDYADNCANTKTFYLVDDQDTSTAQEILDYFNAGHNPVVSYNNEIYVLYSVSGASLMFISPKLDIQRLNTKTISVNPAISIQQTSNGIIISIGNVWQKGLSYRLETDYDYPTAYTPQHAGSPTTKQYVDNKVSNEPYTSAWNNDTTHAPSKDAIYDVLGDINTLLANI